MNGRIAATSKPSFGDAVVASMNPGGVCSPGFTYSEGTTVLNSDCNWADAASVKSNGILAVPDFAAQPRVTRN